MVTFTLQQVQSILDYLERQPWGDVNSLVQLICKRIIQTQKEIQAVVETQKEKEDAKGPQDSD